MPYREIPPRQEQYDDQGPLIEEEMRRFNKQLKIIAVVSLILQAIVVACYFLY